MRRRATVDDAGATTAGGPGPETAPESGRRPARAPGSPPRREAAPSAPGSGHGRARGWLRKLPVVAWLGTYRRAWLRADLTGGLTVAAVVIPHAMACAAIAGLAVETGLYTALAAMAVYPLLGSSRALSVSTTSAIAMLTAAVVDSQSRAGGPSPIALATTLTLLVGGILVLACIFRLGFLANFISKPVLVGFQCGVGVVILVGQLGAVLGVQVPHTTTFKTLLALPGLVAHAHLPTMLVAVTGLAVLLALPRIARRVPAAFVWLGASLVISALLGLEARGVAVIGAVPPGLPHVALPSLDLVAALWPAALGIALMSFTETVAIARTFCGHDDAPIRPGAELLGVGAANVAAALVGGMPAGGGASQTTVAEKAGVRSQLAQWFGAAVVLVVLLFLSRAVGHLPKAALGALVLVAGASMIKPEMFRAIARVRRRELVWALVTVVGVVAIGTLPGILIAVVVSILTLFYQANHPAVYALAYCRQKDVFRPAGVHPGDETFPGLLMLRSEGRLTFANAASAGDKMRALVAEAKPSVIVLECSAIPDIEYTALLMLTEAEQNQRERGASLWLAALNPELFAVIQRAPLGAALGRERMFFDLHKAFAAWEAGARPTGPASDRRE